MDSRPEGQRKQSSNSSTLFPTHKRAIERQRVLRRLRVRSQGRERTMWRDHENYKEGTSAYLTCDRFKYWKGVWNVALLSLTLEYRLYSYIKSEFSSRKSEHLDFTLSFGGGLGALSHYPYYMYNWQQSVILDQASFMAPSRALKSQRISLVGNDEIEAMELSQPGSQSSDDNQVTKMAAKMQREVLWIQTWAKKDTRVDDPLGQKTSRGSTLCYYQFIPGSSEQDRECYDVEVRAYHEANVILWLNLSYFIWSRTGSKCIDFEWRGSATWFRKNQPSRRRCGQALRKSRAPSSMPTKHLLLLSNVVCGVL